MWVYRDGFRTVRAREARRRVLDALERGRGHEGALEALLSASEIETALEDAGAPAIIAARRVTDMLADAWVAEKEPVTSAIAGLLSSMELPERLRLRTPEGYAYYALDPMSYVGAAAELRCDVAVIVGIRSIGTSLSAVVSAALRRRGIRAERFTVRPVGHPYDRRCELDADAARRVGASGDAAFVIVDEGPGLSGSSFLAVGERLESAGVPVSRIQFVTSHSAQPKALCAPRAAERWARFKVTPAPDAAGPPVDGTWAGAGEWRRLVYADEADYPAVWRMLERAKYISIDGAHCIKFGGYPPYGDAGITRGEILAEAGYCPPSFVTAPGYVAHRWVSGAPLSLRTPRALVLPRLVDYLAFRHRAFPAPGADSGALSSMLEVNASEALGASVECPRALDVERPVYADGRLLPHEWVDAGGAALLKVDATDHGDDHLLPGPCDSAWDVAGAVIEWQLSPREARHFVAAYRARTGDDVGGRLAPYLAAYAAYRVGWCQMALSSSDGDEARRLEQARRRYSRALEAMLRPALARAIVRGR